MALHGHTPRVRARIKRNLAVQKRGKKTVVVKKGKK
jgi:ribosomal protein L35AE/L33A